MKYIFRGTDVVTGGVPLKNGDILYQYIDERGSEKYSNKEIDAYFRNKWGLSKRTYESAFGGRLELAPLTKLEKVLL